MGLPATVVLAAAVKDLLAHDGPAMLDVVTNPDEIAMSEPGQRRPVIGPLGRPGDLGWW